MEMAETGKRLVKLARDSINHALVGGPPVIEPEGPFFEKLAATFVTLHTSGALHGCVGSLEPRCSLVEDVRHNALAAAFQDPRFPPLNAEELDGLKVEVSLLSPLEPIQFEDEADALSKITPFVHGVVLRYGSFVGTFLPQVWEKIPDKIQFFGELKRKAGLPRDFWSPEIQVFRYTLQKWGDEPTRPPVP